jgi:ribosomal protein S7
MAHGRNNGKKLMAVRIVAHAFEIVSSAHLQTPTDSPLARFEKPHNALHIPHPQTSKAFHDRPANSVTNRST